MAEYGMWQTERAASRTEGAKLKQIKSFYVNIQEGRIK